MRKVLKKHMLMGILTFTMVMPFTACGGNDSSSIAGTWKSEDGGGTLVFDEDGTCSVPPIDYEKEDLSCRYTLDKDGVLTLLVVDSNDENIDTWQLEQQDSAQSVEEMAEYYLSDDTLVLYLETVHSYTKQ